jgi:hypothetical protein
MLQTLSNHLRVNICVLAYILFAARLVHPLNTSVLKLQIQVVFFWFEC